MADVPIDIAASEALVRLDRVRYPVGVATVSAPSTFVIPAKAGTQGRGFGCGAAE